MKLFNNLESYTNRIAVIEQNEKKYTYKDILKIEKNLSNIIKEKDKIFLICENTFDFISIYASLLRLKSVIFLIEESTNNENFYSLIKNFEPNYIFTTKNKVLNNYKKLLLKDLNYNLYKTNYKSKLKKKNNLAILISTSGTTSSFKFVMLSHENIFDNTKKIAEYLNINSRSRTITTMPSSYSYGLSIINTHLFKGASIITTKYTFFEKKFWFLFKKYKPDNLNGVPFIFEILKKIKIENFNLSKLKYVTQAGGKLDNNLIIHFNNLFKKNNIRFYTMYGQTEASPRMSYLNYDMIEKKLGSIGRAIKNGKFYLVDSQKKNITKKNTIGELAYKGKNIMIGYANKSNDLEIMQKNKILYTGDLAKKDKDGYYYIVGRKSRFIKLFGSRISLDDLENKIKEDFEEVACTGEDNKIIIFLTKKNNIEKIISKLFNNFRIKKNIIEFKLIKKIPKNNNGKIKYSSLKM
tara:strand:- start:316 stop:1713 length:1398 start_codon:yes stop_codon:yes gene_type:complete